MSKLPVTLAASLLLSRAREAGAKGLIVVVASEHRAEALARLLSGMDPDRTSLWVPAWDCLPYDRAAPSADVMGRRMRALRKLQRSGGGAITVLTPEAVLQRTPPPQAFGRVVGLAVGEPLDVEAFARDLAGLGYVHADRVEEPGSVAVRGEVIDLYPAGPRPARVTVVDGRIVGLHRFDAVTQRSTGDLDKLRIGAASELVETGGGGALARFPGMEHWLPDFYPETATLPDIAPQAAIMVEPEAEERVGATLTLIAEAYRDRSAADAHDMAARKALPPERLYLTAKAWTALTRKRAAAFPGRDVDAGVPRFFMEDKPGQAFAAFLQAGREAGQRIVLASLRERDAAALARHAERVTGASPGRETRWSDVEALGPGAVAAMRLGADHGFADPESRITMITAADLLGSYARASTYHAVHVPWHAGDGEFAVGDAVIHLAHGVGVLRGLETLEGGAAAGRDAVRLDYAHEATLLVPVEEMDAVWRLGAPEGVSLDRLDTEGWHRRCGKIAREMDSSARALVEMAQHRDGLAAPRIVPPRRDYERFVARFPYAPSPDQIHAIDDCLKDLAAARPMDRLVVGDVGFGKTEVALRAAAAAVLAGHQVAVVAPTTVLVRQHVITFAKRFAEFGIEVVQLSRLVSAEEARATKEALADGRARIVIGTHALAARDVAFQALGLLIVDEEQRFGAADKARIRALGTGTHVLTLTATPIPRTLQSALVGLQDLSVVATPPARRRPVRTLVSRFDKATIRTALLREKARGGQGFVVLPRIEDLERIRDELASFIPELGFMTAHGRMDAQKVDDTMVGFAEGGTDVLLATSIIESGLDVPRANTMIVCGAEHFGLAQLHQLRGRVGRGSRQGLCYLMTEADQEVPDGTARRLATLARYDRLGSGMAISARDLDARGAGDLVGEEQAGHMRLIGLGLYQHLLQRAIREARGETVEDWTPEIRIEGGGHLPEAYIPEPEVRLNLYARIARLAEPRDIEALAEEMEDRFGPLPEPVADLVATARLKSLCRRHGIARIDGGPKAIALTPRPGISAQMLIDGATPAVRAGLDLRDGRLIHARETATSRERLERASHVLEGLH